MKLKKPMILCEKQKEKNRSFANLLSDILE